MLKGHVITYLFKDTCSVLIGFIKQKDTNSHMRPSQKATFYGKNTKPSDVRCDCHFISFKPRLNKINLDLVESLPLKATEQNESNKNTQGDIQG